MIHIYKVQAHTAWILYRTAKIDSALGLIAQTCPPLPAEATLDQELIVGQSEATLQLYESKRHYCLGIMDVLQACQITELAAAKSSLMRLAD